jgi:hypothetical protein
MVCVYHCRTYYNAVRVGYGVGRVEEEEEEDLFMEEEEEEEDLFGVGRVDRVLTHASHMYVLTP